MPQKSTLLVAFENVVKQFNACGKKGDYNANLRPLLHPNNVIISKVDDTTPPTSFATADGVIDYLEKNQTDKFPRFKQSTKKGEETPEETPTDSSAATVAQVTGIATYKDTKDTLDADALRVRYFFTFTRERADDACPWLLINASTPKVAP